MKSHDIDTITCETGSASQISSIDTAQPGSPGVRRRIYNNTLAGTSSLGALTSYSYTEVLATGIEAPQNQGDFYGNAFGSYFKAPVTTNYRFYASCDDRCNVLLSNVDKDPSQK